MRLLAEILDVGIGSEAGVIGEIPAWVIGVVVYHDVVAVPQPIAGVVKVVRSYAPEEAAKPETISASAFEAIDVVATNFTAEASVFPYVILVVPSIVAATFMTDPLIVLSMHVRSFGMTLLIAIRGAPLVAARTTAPFVAALCPNRSAAGVATLWLSPASVRSWAVSGYVTSANLRAMRTAAASWMLAATTTRWMLTAASRSLLGKRRQRQNQ
jgi:hypothetical protein